MMGEEAELPDYLQSLFDSPGFQQAVDSVGTPQPQWNHPCSGCTFLGSYEISVHRLPPARFDLYAHGDEAVSARYGPKLSEYVIAQIGEAEAHRFEEPTHPLVEAVRLWKEKAS